MERFQELLYLSVPAVITIYCGFLTVEVFVACSKTIILYIYLIVEANFGVDSAHCVILIIYLCVSSGQTHRPVHPETGTDKLLYDLICLYTMYD